MDRANFENLCIALIFLGFGGCTAICVHSESKANSEKTKSEKELTISMVEKGFLPEYDALNRIKGWKKIEEQKAEKDESN